MQVLHLISSSGFYGTDSMLIELSKQLSTTAFLPIVGVFKNLHNPRLEVAEVAKSTHLQVEILPCNGKMDFKTILSIRKLLKKHQIDIIHSHGYKSNLYALCASFPRRVPRVATCHNWLGDDAKMKFYARLDKSLLNRFDRVIAVSDSIMKEILNHNISGNIVLTISNGINLERFKIREKPNTLREKLGIDERFKVVGTVGRLAEEKGHIYLLDAAQKVLRKYQNVVFMIVGDGPLRRTLQDKVSQMGQGGVASPFIFTGIRGDMPDIYSTMDIFVLPSLTEGLPMALLEALAAHKPVVATRVGAVPQVIEDNHSGLLIPPTDVESLSSAIMHLLENPQKAKHLAQNGYERVRDHFSAKRMAEQYIKVYKNVLRARRKKG